jgi:hypothetical protein
MPLTKLTASLNIIQALADRIIGQASATKAKLDEGTNTIKTYINDTLTAEIDAAIDALPTTAEVLTKTNTDTYTPTANYHPATKKYVDDTTAGVILGQIPDSSLTEGKLAFSPLTTLPTAGGTATALTIAQKGFSLTNGAKAEFIASANNNGAATTADVESKGAAPVYKPGGTDAPTLVEGKAYTIWYDTSGGNFFIKASATGDAVAANVLAGKIFSNDTDTDITGTMPNKSSDTFLAQRLASASGVISLCPQEGYYNGDSNNYVSFLDDDFVAGNIKKGTDIFGITGAFTGIKSIQTGYVETAGNGSVGYADVTVSSVNASYSVVLWGQAVDLNVSNLDYNTCIAYLTSSTNLRVFKDYSASANVYGTYVIIEFDPASVKSFQTNKYTSKGAKTISSVSTSKTAVFYHSRCKSPGNDTTNLTITARLTGATELTIAGGNDTEFEINTYVVEFN